MAWVVLAGVAVTSCGANHDVSKVSTTKKRSKEYFAESAYGVKASPRVVENGPVPKGGGRRLVGNPYVVAGKVYKPRENPNYEASGLASWYGSAFHGRYTANGEVYDQYGISAAHPTMPLPSYARVTNLDTGSSVIVRVNDRGPFHANRLIDLSDKAAELLDVKGHGTAHVKVKYVGPADMTGHDMPYLMASYVRKGQRVPGVDPFGGGQIASGVMVASNAPQQNFFGRFAGPASASAPQPKTAKPVIAPASASAYGSNSYPVSVSANAPRPVQRQPVAVSRPEPTRIEPTREWQAPAIASAEPMPQPRNAASTGVARREMAPVAAPQPVRATATRQKPVAAPSGGGLPPGWHVGPAPVTANAYSNPNEG
ncbi:septal ring lytic transglycosylase RlpA family protein [Agrobacterium vitis]|uniref:septal ring lytic transglycosylase RlpA family protein n=1 Tax=Agrobacterium vitis TaxID=373 RepID=UPI003D2917B9